MLMNDLCWLATGSSYLSRGMPKGSSRQTDLVDVGNLYAEERVSIAKSKVMVVSMIFHWG
jgi:hypothetical protein